MTPAFPVRPDILARLPGGRYRARLAQTPEDLEAAQRLRWLCFLARTAGPSGSEGRDADPLDARFHHLLIEDGRTGMVVCCLRFLLLDDGGQVAQGHAAQVYDLSALRAFDAPLMEIGRFCVHPSVLDPDIIRTAWAALAAIVDRAGVRMLFGCSSFAGADPARHAAALALLHRRHLGPRRWAPGIKASAVYPLGCAEAGADPRRAMAAMPPLLRSYLAMGGWVGDHAVIDPGLDTIHIFTAVEVGAIPKARQRLLRRPRG